MQTVSKSKLKPHLLEYLRMVETQKIPLIVTHGGKPVITIAPFKEDPEEILKTLRNSVISYEDPFEPVGEEDWEALK